MSRSQFIDFREAVAEAASTRLQPGKKRKKKLLCHQPSIKVASFSLFSSLLFGQRLFLSLE